MGWKGLEAARWPGPGSSHDVLQVGGSQEAVRGTLGVGAEPAVLSRGAGAPRRPGRQAFYIVCTWLWKATFISILWSP